MFRLPWKSNDQDPTKASMAKAFTYSRLPEHQVAIYYDGGDRTGEIISAVAVVLEPNRSF